MNWNKRFINTSKYDRVKDTVGIFPSFESCRDHIVRHVCNRLEPWHLVLDVEKYTQNGAICQISDEITVEIYEQIALEIEKSVHFMFLSGCCVYIGDFVDEDGWKGERIYGVGPLGIFVALSAKNVLTSFFPRVSWDSPTYHFHRFWTSVRHALLAAQKAKKAPKAARKMFDMQFDPKRYWGFRNLNTFQLFLEKYRQIEKNENVGESVACLLQEDLR